MISWWWLIVALIVGLNVGAAIVWSTPTPAVMRRRRAADRASGYPRGSAEAWALLAGAVDGPSGIAFCTYEGTLFGIVDGQRVEMPPLGVVKVTLPSGVNLAAVEDLGSAAEVPILEYARTMHHVPEDSNCAMHWALDPSVRQSSVGHCRKCEVR